MSQTQGAVLVRSMPWVFVLIWSIGFIVAKCGMPYAPPFGFLSIRYAPSLLCFAVWIAMASQRRPVAPSVCHRRADARRLPRRWLVALLSITTGALYQKRFVEPCDVRTANAVQLMAAFVISLPLALIEREAIVMHPQFFGAMAWSVIGLTLGGSSLMYLLIQRGAVTKVTSLLYLVPPTTATMAWVLFGEALTLPMLAGMALTAAGVAIVARSG